MTRDLGDLGDWLDTLGTEPEPDRYNPITWAERHAYQRRWRAMLDNYEPTRDYTAGNLWLYDTEVAPDGEQPILSDTTVRERVIARGRLGIVLGQTERLRDAHRADYLVYFLQRAPLAFYVASYREGDARGGVVLHQRNHYIGNGPSRTYHLEVTP